MLAALLATSPAAGAGALTPLQPAATAVPQLAQYKRRGGPDHNDARDAVRSGQALPLGDIIASVQRYCPGRFLDAQLRQQGRRLVYHVLMLSNSGRRVTIVVDARNGAVIGGRCG